MTATKIAPTTATIDQLKRGSDRPGGTVNSRKDYAPADVKARLASILQFGILRALLVIPAPDSDTPPFYVADGGLSREAVELGVKEKKLPADYAVKITVMSADAATALAASLEANDQVVPPHPVKVYETFAQLQERGKTPEEIGALFRMTMKDVRGTLALGALSPKIRKAWTDDTINADTAKAFTLAKDHAAQDATFEKLKRTRDLYAGAVKEAITGGGSRKGQRLLNYVGQKNYEAAGGKLQEDLFSEKASLIVGDMPLLTKLADAKYAADKQALKDAGWGTVADEGELPNDHWYTWKAVSGGAKATAANKAKGTAAVTLNDAGKLEVKYLLKPDGKKGAAKASVKSKTAAPKTPTTLSNSLRDDMDKMGARALKDALVADSYPTMTGKITAGIVAALITAERYHHTPSEIRKQAAAIRDSITPKVMNDALVKRFDFKRYFPGAPKLLVIRAISEAVSPDQAKKLDAGTKAAAWKFALANVPKTGWLPPELRHAGYAGPGAKAAAKKSKK